MAKTACVRNQDGYQLGSYLGTHILRLQRRNRRHISNELRHGRSSAKFRVGVSYSFKMLPLARPIAVKMIPLARLNSTSKVP